MSTENKSAPGAVKPGWALGLVSIGAFLISLDVMVVVTALPTIRVQLHASLPDLEWTINAYNLAFATLMLTGSAIGDRFGRRRMYVFGLTLFSLASVMAATASSIQVLLISRVILGVAAAIALPLSLTLLSDAFPPEKRGMAMGIWGGVSGVAIAAGPVVGGAITQGLSWHWIFWLNVPIGLVAAVLSSVKLRESYGPRPKMDIVGQVLAGIGLLGLTWAAVESPTSGWSSAKVIGGLVVGAVFVVSFIAWEHRVEHPMMPLGYFRSRGFSTANVVAFFQHFALIGSLFMVSQLFQTGLGNTPLGAGLRLLVWTGMPLLVAPLAGGFADKIGNRPFMVAGMALQAVGLAWVATESKAGSGYGSFVLPLIVGGVGISMCFPTVANAVMGSVPQDDVGVASGTNNALRELGGVFGVAILAATFAAHGSYASAGASLPGFRAALYVAASGSAVGVIGAVLSPGRRRPEPAAESAVPLLEAESAT